MPTAPCITLDTLQSFKSSQLQRLAVAVGTATSGRKLALASRLLAAFRDERTPQLATRDGARPGRPRAPLRILSLDMGVRNLAYCALEAPQITCEASKQARHSVPIVRDWRRLALLPEPPATKAADTPVFALPNVARTAAALVRRLVLDAANGRAQPDAVLIERQRWRSGGGAAVQEWTLRVNTLEALLWGGLAVARAEGLWHLPGAGDAKADEESYGGGVWGIDPGRVARWWLEPVAEEEPKSVRTTVGRSSRKRAALGAKVNVKRRKIAVVADWLENETQVTFEGAAAVTRTAFLDQFKGTRRRRKKESNSSGDNDGESKLDDLADSLLQAVAWLHWQENKLHILEKGLAAANDFWT